MKDRPGKPPLPIFEDAALAKMVNNDQLDCKQFLQPRHEYLRQNMNTGEQWLRPIYQNVQTVMEYSAMLHKATERRQLQEIKELLERIAKLDNHTAAIHATFKDTFQIMHDQKVSLDKELTILKRQPVRDEAGMMNLKSNYEASWKSLQMDLKAQRDVLAIEEDLLSETAKSAFGPMKTIIITTQNGVVNRDTISSGSNKPFAGLRRSRPWVWVAGGIVLLVLIGLGIGLGVGLTSRSRNKNSGNSSDVVNNGTGAEALASSSSVSSSTSSIDIMSSQSMPVPTTGSTAPTATYKVRPSRAEAVARWLPTAGETWEIALIRPPNNTAASVTAFDLDLFDNSQSFIANLQRNGHKVICYFSAGSFEDWRPDAQNFNKEDYGEAMDGWPGEWWLNINSQNVRNIMASRIALAQSKGCDAVDPDNINGYQNPTGFDLTEKDSISYLDFMASEAHERGMSIGLKNGGAIVANVVQFMDFCVQESCVAYNECEPYRTFLEYNSPVFHIEYPEESNMAIAEICSPTNGAQGFSTVIKRLSLDDWTVLCPS
ncbi:hypothetical protein Dda_3552 [Drechslerella dactyloides]|uniref:alpha-galactosidase n=1 Tax=Drechslerella dactyloides TaxID=74499 RepID=A0AAD6NIL0_DREDA|nr:hypothetical protein Dda_3552 [Drechslerella dactyloides]